MTDQVLDRPELDRTPPNERVERVVVVGVDGSAESVEAAQYAAEAADARGLDLLVVHAFVPSPSPGTAPGARAVAARLTHDALTRIRMPVGLHVHWEVEPTTPGALLLRRSRGASLVALGQHVFDLADQPLEGLVAGPLVAAAGCPVVVVPRGWSRAPRRVRTVAVALDGTSSAEPVLAFALDEAARHQSPLLVLHARKARSGAAADVADRVDLEEILAAAKQDHPDLAVSVQLTSGDAAEAVRDASRHVTLMVVGRPHRAPRLWAHSLTIRVLADARCPLVVV